MDVQLYFSSFSFYKLCEREGACMCIALAGVVGCTAARLMVPARGQGENTTTKFK